MKFQFITSLPFTAALSPLRQFKKPPCRCHCRGDASFLLTQGKQQGGGSARGHALATQPSLQERGDSVPQPHRTTARPSLVSRVVSLLDLVGFFSFMEGELRGSHFPNSKSIGKKIKPCLVLLSKSVIKGKADYKLLPKYNTRLDWL